jgi:hypothetical protein
MRRKKTRNRELESYRYAVEERIAFRIMRLTAQ